MEFWCIGYKSMEGKFLRLMVRIKHTGIVATNNVSAITSKLDKISNGGNNFKSFILEIDGNKIVEERKN